MDQVIGRPRAERLEETVVASPRKLTVHHVVALSPSGQHRGNSLGRVLQVALQEDQRISLRVEQAGGQ